MNKADYVFCMDVINLLKHVFWEVIFKSPELSQPVFTQAFMETELM